MPTSSDVLLEPLESLASSGKKYGDGTADANGNSFLPLTSTAWQEQHHPGGAATLPMLTTTFEMGLGGFAQGAAQLPSLIGGGWTAGQGAAALPSLTTVAAGTVFGSATSDTTLPMLVGAGSVTSGGTAATAGVSTTVLPSLTGAGWFAGLSRTTLPSLAGAGHVTAREFGTSATVLPSLQGAGTSAVFSYPSYSYTILPALQGGETGGFAYLILPSLRGAGYDAGSVAGSGIGVGAFEGWALNRRTGFVGRITNWPFRQIVKWGDLLLGVGADGLYLIGGTKDVGQPMQWEWRTGLDDMGNPGVKRIPYLYLDAVIDGEVEITTIDDHGDMRSYHYEADRGRINMPHRRELGKGVRTRNIAIGARNGTNGAYMEMYSLEPEATVTQRSI